MEGKLTTAYPKFIEEFKRNVIEYGRTVRKLPANELLIFKLDLNTCEDCDIPDRVEISIKKSVLESYDSNKITMEQALEQITTKTIPAKD
ncbi:MAG: hypothetical protein IPJ74_25355 [Saprospiraceae bacterium]|nr:hypothetical protein [Saprospiraceae bacterium]